MQLLLAIVILIVGRWVFAQNPVDVPRFEAFPIVSKFHGRPVEPVLKTQGDRLFRTRIREAAKGGPNFAGRYTIAEWGCGSACSSMVVVDAKTGAIHEGPFSILGSLLRLYYGETMEKSAPRLEYRLNSRLLIARGCPEDEVEECATYFYEWTGRAFNLLRRIPADRIPE